ncbi:hypothetical protein LCM10_00370 [Rossellomorea aquimaris]|uniref:hypothetical protein n=1 Tax=Rossellomorea aquimaris TaxID=189382 RepID=UPI001CD3970E|nr:hypothetical protein [Rossellomorea aquimaris]MCA1053419.1 hypothetical protein [Rossellomorea aquimaris]
MLTYEDVKQLFPDTKGVALPGIGFQNVSSMADMRLERGLFIPIGSHEDLLEGIGNGVIASLWDKAVNVPMFVPNHFPLFFVEDLRTAQRELITFYKQKNNQEKWEIMTKFICSNESEHTDVMDNKQESKLKEGGE